MKLSSLFAAVLFTGVAAIGFAHAADSDKAATPKADDTQMMEKPAAKPHSHVQEKTGLPQSTPKKKKKPNGAAKDTTKHFHPRDMK